MEDRIFMKFETYAYNRVMDHQNLFCKDLCTNTRAWTKNVRVRINVHVKMCAHIFMPRMHMFLQKNFMKIVLLVHYYVTTLSLKFHKDPSFCYGDMCKIMLNMHARVIYMHLRSFDIHACTLLLHVRAYVHRSLPKFFW